MKEALRRTLIPELDQFTQDADELRKELNYLVERHQIYKDPRFSQPVNEAYELVASLKKASDELKRAATSKIRDEIIDWYHFRVDLDVPEEEREDQAIESVVYKGENRWEIIMTSVTHGCERIEYDTDTATWNQVYSAERI